jgi:leader peptidase (prepilin peptidase) / N-methyltransferase
MMWIFALFVFVAGTIVGSFVNVVIERTIAGEDWIKARSRCDNCKKMIAWYDNIPLFSYFLLGRRCRYCKKRISIQHPAIEFMMGALFVWWYAIGFAFFQLSQQPLIYIQPLFWLVVGILLLIVLITDLKYMIIPDYAVVGLGLLALVYRVYLTRAGVMQIEDLWGAVLAGVVASLIFLGLHLGTGGKGMGLGDVKFVLVMGLLLGWQRMIVGTLLAFVLGALVGVGLLLAGKKTFSQELPFGPFLVAGTVIALLWGSSLWSWYWRML